MLQKLLKRLGLLVFSIFILNTCASLFSWYYTLWWFDMPMHYLGGVFISLLTVFISIRYVQQDGAREVSSDWKEITFVIAISLLVSVMWEYFEIIFNNIMAGQPFSVLDTFSDLFFDLAGISTGILYVYLRYPFLNQIRNSNIENRNNI